MRVTTRAVGDHGAPLTAYVLDTSEEMATASVRPAVLILPGGGYFCTSDREAEPVALAYIAEGFHAFVLRYSTGEDVPYDRSYADGLAGLAWVRDHAAEYGVDPARIAVVGFSAGGHLASALGTLSEPKPAALVLGYPVIDAGLGAELGKILPDTADAVTEATPPTFLFTTADDAVVPVANSLRFAAALAAHGVPFELHVYRSGEHRLSLAKPLTANGHAGLVDPVVQGWFGESVRFVHELWGDFPVVVRNDSAV